MGAAEQQQFSQYPLRYGDGTLGAAIAQTRGGRDELITPVALWELDDSSGLYLPPGLSQNPRRPRVDAQLSGSIAESLARGEADTRVVIRSGILAAGQSETVLDTRDNILSLSLEFGTDSQTVRIIIDTYLEDGTTSAIRVLTANGDGYTAYLTPILLETHRADLFDTLVYDTTTNAYKFGLRRNLQFAAGVRITVQNPNGSDHQAGVNVIYVRKK